MTPQGSFSEFRHPHRILNDFFLVIDFTIVIAAILLVRPLSRVRGGQVIKIPVNGFQTLVNQELIGFRKCPVFLFPVFHLSLFPTRFTPSLGTFKRGTVPVFLRLLRVFRKSYPVGFSPLQRPSFVSLPVPDSSQSPAGGVPRSASLP